LQGEVLAKVDSDDYNTTWVPQNFRVFADAAARTTAIPTPTDGMLTYLQDVNSYETFSDTAFVPLVKQGLTLIKTQTIGTAVPTVVITDAFSATYDAYKIIIAGGAASSTQNLRLQLGNATSGYYQAGQLVTYAGASSPSNANNTSIFTFVGFGTSVGLSMNIDMVNPFLATRTYFSTNLARIDTSGAFIATGGFLSNANSYTGFTISPASGTLTGGTIFVYGYRKEV
jgi:hypothetical protein